MFLQLEPTLSTLLGSSAAYQAGFCSTGLGAQSAPAALLAAAELPAFKPVKKLMLRCPGKFTILTKETVCASRFFDVLTVRPLADAGASIEGWERETKRWISISSTESSRPSVFATDASTVEGVSTDKHSERTEHEP
jgi:hypothetical protein